MSWRDRPVVVTGGAGFIGSHLVGVLLREGARVYAVDHVYAGAPEEWDRRIERAKRLWNRDPRPLLADIDLLRTIDEFTKLLQQARPDLIFHLAAVFGGRGFVDTRPADCGAIAALDYNVFLSAYRAGIDRVVYASSACVYPPKLQETPGYALKEDDILSVGDGWRSSDNLYGFAKLLGELQLMSFHQQYGMKGSILRFLTVYGPGEFGESHALNALVNRALRREDPYLVWGDGSQERGFTYVGEIADGLVLAADKVDDCTPINLGHPKRYSIREVVKMILETVGHTPKEIHYDEKKPVGPYSRILDINRAKALLGWDPKVDLSEGLQRMVSWYR